MIVWTSKVYFENRDCEHRSGILQGAECNAVVMKRATLNSLGAVLIALCCTLLGSSPTVVAQGPVESKRLILKDGSYQIVSKWEMRGNRVRYYSVKRYDWEEVPNSLVDWSNAVAVPHAGHFSQRIDDRLLAAEADHFGLDRRAGQPLDFDDGADWRGKPGHGGSEPHGADDVPDHRGRQDRIELVQNGGELNKQTGKNIMRAIINPLPTGSRQSIELKGLRARVQTHNSFPNLYVDIDNSDSDNDSEKPNSSAPAIGPNGIGSAPAQKPNNDSAKAGTNPKLNQPDRFKIVRLQTKKDSRVVSNVKISLLGKVSNEEDIIPTTAEPVKRLATELPRSIRLAALASAGVTPSSAEPGAYRSFITLGALRCDQDVGLHLLTGTLLI